ncbi:hypothetical protein H0G86_008325 [Trichoderma simmonsii]|uniref:Uncharacterized protein n=1 Tax=Trichoderma simmonsii TaxID=1491479 RepID=A0A8G0PG14_9HYPO|nr:hypothetical protein H0G86_008325 [Trichoderma simmonsii]
MSPDKSSHSRPHNRLKHLQHLHLASIPQVIPHFKPRGKRLKGQWTIFCSAYIKEPSPATTLDMNEDC